MSSLSLSLIVFACIFGGALFGLTLRKLLQLLGGHFQIDSRAGQGTRLTADLPVDAAAQKRNN